MAKSAGQQVYVDAPRLLHGDVGKLASFFGKRGVDPGRFYRLEQTLQRKAHRLLEPVI